MARRRRRYPVATPVPHHTPEVPEKPAVWQDPAPLTVPPASEDDVVFSREVVTVWRHSDPQPLDAIWLGIRSRQPTGPHLVLHRNGRHIEVPFADVADLQQIGGRRVA